MASRLVVLVALLALTTASVPAQNAAPGHDAMTVLRAASKAMGADNLKNIQIIGTEGSFIAGVGQSFNLAEDWPRFEMTNYTRIIDYDAKSSREEYTFRKGRYPAVGGGGPMQGEQRRIFNVSGNYAWNMDGNNVIPAPAAAELRQLDIWMTPHGFLKAAMAGNPTTVSLRLGGTAQAGMTSGGGRVTIVSFMHGKYRINGTINDQNLIELIQTRVANPVFGDMLYESRFSEYRDFGGVKFPTLIHSHQGDYVLNAGENSMDVRVGNIQVNGTVPALAVPDAVRQAKIPPVRVESQKVADGIWLVGGGSHNSVAVEFRDFSAVIEAPLNEERSLAVIEEVYKLIPNKPIRYVVNTHHHFDHLGGLRTYVAHGATVVTHQGNRYIHERVEHLFKHPDFYMQVLFSSAPRTLEPDILSTVYPYFAQGRRPHMELVQVLGKHVLSDGVRTLDIYPVTGLAHAAHMVVAYLPKEKILVNADLYSPPAQTAQPPMTPTPSMVTLRQNIQNLKLDVAQHVPIHGRVGTMEEFLKIVKTGSTE